MPGASDDHFGDLGPIVAGRVGRDRRYGLVDEDLLAFVDMAGIGRSNTVVDDLFSPDINGQVAQWHARRALPGTQVEACSHMRGVLARRCEDGRDGQLRGTLELVRLDERGHPGINAALDELCAVRDHDAQGFRRLVDGAKRVVLASPSPEKYLRHPCGAPPRPETGDPVPTNAAPPATRTLKVTRASEVVSRRLRWLWDLRIVLGGLTLIAGREGLGKSTIAVWLAALVTRGLLPGELVGTPRTVIYVNSEDARDYTIRPRLEAAGADLDRVLFIDAVMPGAEGEVFTESIVLPRDAHMLADLTREEDAALVILDAATSVIDSKLDGDKDRQMRQGLEAIGRVVGEATGAAVAGVVHFGKRDSNDTGKLILGSIAWSQVARSVLAVAASADGASLVITRSKGNLGMEPPSIAVRIESATVATPEGDTSVGRVVLIGETDQDARTLLVGLLGAEQPDEEERSALDEAKEWLRDYLSDPPGGNIGAKAVFAAAAKDGHSERTLKRAKRDIGVKVAKTAVGWSWSLSPVTSEDVQGGQAGQGTRTCTEAGPLGTLGPLEALCTGCELWPPVPGFAACQTCSESGDDAA